MVLGMRNAVAFLLGWFAPLMIVGAPGLSYAGEWFSCGNLAQLTEGQLPAYVAGWSNGCLNQELFCRAR